MLETSWLWFVISKEYVELTRPKIESRDPIFFTGTRSRSRVSGNDRLFPRGSEFGPNLEIPAGPAIQLRPGPGYSADTKDKLHIAIWGRYATTWYQYSRKTFMIHQTFVRWALYILFKFVKSLIRHLGLAIGNVRCVRWFLWTLWYSFKTYQS